MTENKSDIKKRDTKQRREVYEEVMSRKDHPTADSIYLSLRINNPKISKGTVYRNLNLLSKNGEINYIRVPGADRFDSTLSLHYHVICTSCGTVEDAPMNYSDDLDFQTATATGYKINMHRTVFEGLCPNCQNK